MYKEYPKFYYYESLEYGRKSRMDDPLLSIEETLQRHGEIIDEYARKYLGGGVPFQKKTDSWKLGLVNHLKIDLKSHDY